MAEIAHLQEHQAPSFDKPTDEATPEDTAALKLIEKCYREAKQVRSHYDYDWGSNWRFYLGDQWKEKRPSYRHSEVINFVFSELQTTLALLTDARPTVEYLAQEPSDYEFAQIVSKVVESKWDANSWSAVVAECGLDALAIGTGIACVPQKPNLANGLGDFAFESEDPTYFYVSPGTRTKVNDEYCTYTLTAVPTDIEKVKKDYPDKAEAIKPDLTDLSEYGLHDTPSNENIRLISPVDKDMPVSDSEAGSRYVPKRLLLLTLYLRSDEMVEEETQTGEFDETGQPKIGFQKKKRYPNGRKIVVANNVVLENADNPYESDEPGKKPYARLVDYATPRTFWGVGDVKHMRSPQVIINKLTSYILDVLILMGNPIWVVDTTAGVDTDNLTNQPGLAIEKSPGGDVKRLEGVQLQPYIIQVLENFQERVWNKLASSKEVSQGVQPTENASGYQLELLQDAAQTKIRSKARNLDVFLQEVGDLMLDRILQFYDVPRVFRITNDQNAQQYFKFHVENRPVIDPATQQPAMDDVTGEPKTERYGVVQTFAQTGPGQYAPGDVTAKPLKGRLDVKVSTGSSLPFAKAQKAQKAKDLFKDGILDAEDYLSAIEWPGKEKVIEKYNQRMQAMAQQKAQEAAMGVKPGAGAPPGAPPA